MNREGSEEESPIKVIPWSEIHRRRKIAAGGQGHTFEAELKPQGRTVAIKEVTDTGDFEEDATFGYEARMMARLHHPNIISLDGVAADSTDTDNSRDLNDLVMEYFMPNGDLENALEEDKDFVLLPWRSLLLAAFQVAQAVEYMHWLGIVHFDIKCANVLLNLTDPTRPVCKICDFGLAMEKEDNMGFMHGVGTVGRLAPEMIY